MGLDLRLQNSVTQTDKHFSFKGGGYTCISKIEIFRDFIKTMHKNDFFIMNCVKNHGKKYLDVVWTPVLAKMRQKWVKNAVFS